MSKRFYGVGHPMDYERWQVVEFDGETAVVLNIKFGGLILGYGWRWRIVAFFNRLFSK